MTELQKKIAEMIFNEIKENLTVERMIDNVDNNNMSIHDYVTYEVVNILMTYQFEFDEIINVTPHALLKK